MLRRVVRRTQRALAPFAADGVMLAAAIALGVAVYLGIGSAAAWCYASIVLFVIALLIARSHVTNDLER